MMGTSGFARMARMGAFLVSTAAALPALAQEAAEDTSSSSRVEEIVVTAQKRSENLQVVPIAVSAVTSQSLQAARFNNINDLSAVAPGFTTRIVSGGVQQPTFTMRGVYGAATFASDPGSAYYVDGVYISNTNGAMFDLADVERVEILRGPQGTLFGRNAIGGAVNVITKEPSGNFKFRQELSYGNFDQRRAKTLIDLPAFGPLSISASYLHDEREGDVRNLGAGTVWRYSAASGGALKDRVSPKTLGAYNTDAVSATVKLEPGLDFKAIYRFNWQKKDYSPDVTGFALFTGFPDIENLYNQQNPALMTKPSLTRPREANNAFTTPGELKVQSHSLTLSMGLSDAISVKNILAYRKASVFSTNQLDGIGGMTIQTATPYIAQTAPGVFTPGVLPVGTPVLVLTNATQSFQRSWSNEFQVNIDTEWFKLTAGYLYYNARVREGGFGDGFANAPFGSGLVVAGFGNLLLFPPYSNYTPVITGELDSTLRTKSNAWYFQQETHLTDQLSLVVGARITKDNRSGIDNSVTPAAPGTTVRYNKSTPTYLAGINYQLTPTIFTYAKYSTAYISGGQLANISFDPQTAKSWEAGVKADLWDRRLRVNLALFSVKYGSVQVLTNPFAGCANVPGVSLTAPQCIINGGDAKANGFELETTLVPVDGLTLTGNLAYTDFKYTRVDPALRAADGNFVPNYNPKWTANLGAQYMTPELGGSGARLLARLDANYTSSQFPGANETRALLDVVKIPSTWLLNGRVAVMGYKVMGAEVELAAWVRNLTNDKSLVYGVNLGSTYSTNYQRARTFGLDLIFSL